ncbi:MAG: hypothetical protein AABP62_21425 [Planctomycetota bacterium]
MSHLRCWAVGCVVVLFFGGLGAELVAADADLTAASRVAREAEAKLLAGLHKQVKAEWDNVPVPQVLDTLAKTAGVKLWIDRETLAADGISLEESVVNLHLGNATVWQALHFLLKPLLLDWHGSDGLLSITTQTRMEEIQFTRIYDVQAIVAALEPQLKNLPPRLRANIGGGAGGFCGSGNNGGGGGGFFRVPMHAEERAETTTAPSFVLAQFGVAGNGLEGTAGPGIAIRSRSMTAEELLVELLFQTVKGPGRTVWELRDGEGGTISIGRGRLIVRQTYQTHFQIREMLQVVEEFVVRGSKAKSMLVARPGYPHDEDAAIFQRLAEPQILNVSEAPLSEPLELLASRGRFRLWIDKETLAADGIDVEQQVTLKLYGTALDTVLHKLLDPLLLTFVIEEGSLVVTTAAKAEEMVSTRVYFTGDIPEARSGSDLMAAIQEATSAKWEQVDGEGGAMWKAVPEWLVVLQTHQCHREIAELLDDLRQAAVAPVEAAASELELRLYPVADATALQDLIDSLPKLIPAWDAKQGSVVGLGQSLAIKQPALVHERLDEIFSALNQAHARLNPPKPQEEPKPKPKEEPKPAPAPEAK